MGKTQGRPSLGPHTELRARVQDDVYELTVELAFARGISVPELVRRLLRKEALASMDEIEAMRLDQSVLTSQAS
ncbi:MAG: hypothetical protein ACT4OM_13520 [Actinomycetota bacterium]